MSSVVQNASSQLMNFPKDGIRLQQAQAGIHSFDFVSGLVTFPNGDTQRMSNSLSKLGRQFVKSVFITLSTVDALIRIGQNVLPKSHQLTYVVNGIGFDHMSIEFPVDRTPINDFSYMVIGSDADVFPIDADVLTGSHTPSSKTGTSVDADTTIADFLFTGYTENEIIIENTGGTNTIVGTIEVSQDGVNWVAHQSYPADILPNDFNVFASSVKHRFVRVRVKAKVSAAQSTYRVQLNLER